MSALSVNRRILAAAFTVGAVTLLAKIAGMAKDLAVAYRFGTSDAIDAFLIALVLPTLAINVVANSLSTAFVPTFIAERQRSQEAARRLLESILALSFAALVAATGVMVLTAPVLLPRLGSGFSPEKLAQTTTLLWVLSPIVVISGVVTLYTGVLNAGERFLLGSVAPAAVPVFSLLAVVISGARAGVTALALGTIVGYAVNAAVIAVAVRRVGMPIVPRWHGWSPEVAGVVAQFWPAAAGACLMGGTALVDQAVASTLAPGSVATLTYGNRLVSLATNIGTMALGTAVLPHFARLVAQDQWTELRTVLRTWALVIIGVTVPATLLLIGGSHSLVRVLFQRGAFSSADTAMVTLIQSVYVMQLPFYTLGILFVRTLSSMQRNDVLLWGTAISFPLNLVLDLVLASWIGVAGIALSTSLVYVVSCAYLGTMVYRTLPGRERVRSELATASALGETA